MTRSDRLLLIFLTVGVVLLVVGGTLLGDILAGTR